MIAPRFLSFTCLLGLLLGASALPAQTTAREYNSRGNGRQAKGDLDGAIADFTKAIEINPDYAIAYNNRGQALRAKGDLAGAIADFSTAIELTPNFAAAFANRGAAKRANHDLEGAIADCTKAIGLDPQSASAYSNRGYARKASGDTAGAAADLKKAAQLEGRPPEEGVGRRLSPPAGAKKNGSPGSSPPTRPKLFLALRWRDA